MESCLWLRPWNAVNLWHWCVLVARNLHQRVSLCAQVSYATVIAAYAAARDSQAALKLLKHMRDTTDVAVTTRVCNAALSACERSGCWQQALELLEQMETDGPPPDEVTVRTVVFACCSAKPGPPRLAEAKKIYSRCENTCTHTRLHHGAVLNAFDR